MVPPWMLEANYHAVRLISSLDLQGDIVETGVARGGSSALLALASIAFGAPRRVHLFDTFAGLPPANLEKDGPAAMEWTGKINHSVDEVKNELSRAGVPVVEMLVFHAHDLLETDEKDIPCHIAILRLDTDWAASYEWAFEHLYPRVVPGGIVMLDDYWWWPGATNATDAFLARPENAGIYLNHIGGKISGANHAGAVFCKPQKGARCEMDFFTPTIGI